MNHVKATRRTLIGVAAVAALTIPVAMASADGASSETTGRHSTVSAFGAYSGTLNGSPKPFDPQISNNTLAISPNERIAVATNSESDHLDVIDVRRGRKIAEIKGYVSPRNILFAPDGKTFTVSDSTLGVVDRISLRSHRVVKRLPLGAGVFGTAQSKDGKWLYANNEAASTVTVVDLANSRADSVLTGFAEPRQGVKLDPAGDKLYVTNYKGDRITVVDTKTKKTLQQIEGFKQVRGLSISRDGTRLYAANSETNTVSIVDTESGTTLKRVTVGQKPYGAALAPNEKILLSGNLEGNTLTAVNPASGETFGTVKGLKGPRQAISFSADSKTAWVLNEDLTVAEVDVDALKVTRTLGVR
ncbi:beta-propeller fold lactonase family protein [Streptomyces sp. NPDC002785]|uniref:YncE family protein n=1 Tax=Streptomyces sp. NPDC002785 TaxID=3154543 RepID=UPI0033243145